MLFVIGFFVIFVLGGFSGVMIAVVPFDLVVHDTQFIVAHFHYVLIGGIVFPLFAGIYYWLPQATGRIFSERLGQWSFWVMFAGFHLTFFPLHHTGLVGMPRRVFTYPAGLGWEWTNLAASAGALLFAAGVALTLANLLWTVRRGDPAPQNPWNGGTLEWLRIPGPAYNFRSIPPVETRYPLWDQPDVAAGTEAGRFYLADPLDGRRQTMGSSMVSARPQQIVELPGPTYVPLWAGLCVGLFFVGFLAQLYALSALGIALTLLAVVVWMWDEPDRSHPPRLPAGLGLELPLAHGRHDSPAWSAFVLTLAVDATFSASIVFGYLFLWSYGPDWPPAELDLPELGLAAVGSALLVAGSVVLGLAEAAIRRGRRLSLALGLIGGLAIGAVFLTIQGIEAFYAFGFSPQAHAYAALSYTILGYVAVHVAIAMVLAGVALARLRRGDFAPDRHLGVRLATWCWHYTLVLALVGFPLIYLTPLLF
jgi:cytochrome c oxidase subunit I+III